MPSKEDLEIIDKHFNHNTLDGVEYEVDLNRADLSERALDHYRDYLRHEYYSPSDYLSQNLTEEQFDTLIKVIKKEA